MSDIFKEFDKYINGKDYDAFLNEVDYSEFHSLNLLRLKNDAKKTQTQIEKFIKFNTDFYNLICEKFNEKDTDGMQKSMIYYEQTNIYLKRLQTLYLDAINSRINELNNQESLNKAAESIKLGNRSIYLAIILFILSIFISIRSCKTSDQSSMIIENKLKVLETKINTKNQQINDKIDRAIIPALDSIQNLYQNTLN